MGFEYGMIFGLTLTLQGFGMRAEVGSRKEGISMWWQVSD